MVKTNGIDTEEMNNEEILTLEGQIRADQRVLDQVKEVLGGKMETVEQSVADKLEAEEEARLEAETAQKKADVPGIGYEELFRAGDTVKGEFYRFEGKIIQAMASDSDTRIYRVNITADQRYSRTFWEDTILLTVFGETEQRLLEDDIISFVAVSVGLTSYETVMGATIELPIVAASGTDVTITGRAG